MRVSSNIHLVASGTSGVSLTDALDCNVWLVETGEGLLLFDTGAGRDIAAVLAELTATGLNPCDLRHIFLTHAHADHSGGVAGLLEHLPAGVTVYAGQEAAARMASGDERAISLDTARRLGVYPPDYRWRGAIVDVVLQDDAVVTVGDASIRLLETPGHSDDHCSFLVTAGESTMLISGDAVFANGKVILQDIPDCSVSKTLASLRRLSLVPFETFLPGHGLFSLRDGARHVVRGREFADSGLAPPSFF